MAGRKSIKRRVWTSVAREVLKGPQRPGVAFGAQQGPLLVGGGACFRVPLSVVGARGRPGPMTLGGGRCSQGGSLPSQAPALRGRGWFRARGSLFAPTGRFSRPGGPTRAWRPSRGWGPLFVLKTAIEKNNRTAAERGDRRAGLCSTMTGSRGVKKVKVKRPRSLENQDTIKE